MTKKDTFSNLPLFFEYMVVGDLIRKQKRKENKTKK